MKETQIRYRNLSTPLKIAIVSMWIIGTLFAIGFLIGFIQGLVLI